MAKGKNPIAYQRLVVNRPQFIDEFGESPALSGTLAEIESAWLGILSRMVAKYKDNMAVPEALKQVQTKDITVKDFWLRVYTPPASSDPKPKANTVGIYLHGGGWTMGSVDQEDAICRQIATHHTMTIISVSYRLAPEHRYPAALNDCTEAVTWALANIPGASSVTLIGASAGGNLAFGTALKLLDEGRGATFNGIVALVPVTVHPDIVPAGIKQAGRYTSYDINATATVNTKSAMETFLDAYGAPVGDLYTSCLLHPRIKELKRVYLAECGADTLRDDARLMGGVLGDSGVPLVYRAYPGFPHYSWTYPAPCLEGHRAEFMGDLMEGVKWVSGLGSNL
ncbi:Alpha/Beta hydrolase protein [Aspergillus californicus]